MNNKYNINVIALIKARLETYSLNIKQIKLCLQAGWTFLFGKKTSAIILKGNGLFPM